MSRGNCALCGEPVEAVQTAAWPVTGWEVERFGGGANSIVGRKRADEGIAHASCVKTRADLDRRGIAREQTSLI